LLCKLAAKLLVSVVISVENRKMPILIAVHQPRRIVNSWRDIIILTSQ
jgi:hypothetical protein